MDQPPEINVTINEFNREVFILFLGEFIASIDDRYIQANLDGALKKYILTTRMMEKGK